MVQKFELAPKIIAAISTKDMGSFRLDSVGSPADEIVERRRHFFEALGTRKNVAASLSHSANIKVVSGADAGTRIGETDGLITREKDLALSITVADCIPLFLYDSENEAVGILHAGWRGLERGIIQKAALIWKTVIGDLSTLRVFVGPDIGPCHFEIKDDVRDLFLDYPQIIKEKDQKKFMDLNLLARTLFEKEGLPSENISFSEECTYCLPHKYFSFRRDRKDPLEAMVATIGLLD